jgi:AcrR family transcriptional regulator
MVTNMIVTNMFAMVGHMETPARPVSRRERPSKPALTREGVVATAVELLRDEGLERVTMRRLADELDTGAASLYAYVRNTAELHAAILDELLGGVDLHPVTATGDWTDRLMQLVASYVGVLFEHPSLARSALVMRPSGPHYLDLIEAMLVILAEGGVPDDRAAWAIDLLPLFVTATAAEQGTRDRAIYAGDEEDAVVKAVVNASSERHPRIAALGLDLVSGTGRERFDWCFRVLINGVRHTPRPVIDQAPSDVFEGHHGFTD